MVSLHSYPVLAPPQRSIFFAAKRLLPREEKPSLAKETLLHKPGLVGLDANSRLGGAVGLRRLRVNVAGITALLRPLLPDLLRVGSGKTRLEDRLRTAKRRLGRLRAAKRSLRRLRVNAGIATLLRPLLSDLLRAGSGKTGLEDGLRPAKRCLGRLHAAKRGLLRRLRVNAAGITALLRPLLSDLLRVGSGKTGLEDRLRTAKGSLRRLQVSGLLQRLQAAIRMAGEPAFLGDVLPYLLRVSPGKTGLEDGLRPAERRLGRLRAAESSLLSLPEIALCDVLSDLLRVGPGESRLKYGLNSTCLLIVCIHFPHLLPLNMIIPRFPYAWLLIFFRARGMVRSPQALLQDNPRQNRRLSLTRSG